jgi:tRNA threonylcarbamoyladenosine biosynthesis protein TsaE
MLTSHAILPNPLQLNSSHPGETILIGLNLGRKLQNHLPALLLLKGEIGSGKTYFTKGIAKSFALQEADITSPTFLIVKEHPYSKGTFFHCDFYRLKDNSEMSLFGFFEYVKPKDLYVIEWPPEINQQELKDLKKIFNSIWEIKINITTEKERKIRIEAI